MKKRVASLLIALLLGGLTVLVTFANPYSVDHDTFVDTSNNNRNSIRFLVLNSSGTSGCTPVSGALLQMDMASIVQDTIGTVTLDVVTDSVVSSSGDVMLELFAATADFDETTAGGPLASWVGASLGSTVLVPQSTPAGTILTFPSTSAFVAHMEAARAGVTDRDASVVIQITGCPGTGSSLLNLDTKEAGTGAEFNFWNPSMVKLNNLESSQPTNFVLWVGVVVLLIAAVSLFFYQQRNRQS